jgi:hypothetical protein
MEANRRLFTEDKNLIKDLVASIYLTKYINLDVIYQEIENILNTMNKEEINTSIEKYIADDFDDYSNNPIIAIRKIITANILVDKDLSEMESKIEKQVIDWLKVWNNNDRVSIDNKTNWLEKIKKFISPDMSSEKDLIRFQCQTALMSAIDIGITVALIYYAKKK